MKLVSFCRLHPRRTGGFTLVELLVVLLIVGILTAMAAMMTRAITSGQQRSVTATRLATVDNAIAQFVMLQRRLPCPADGQVAATDATAGIEVRSASGTCDRLTRGVVPWRALGLGEQDATDGWERRFSYRVDPVLTADNAMDLSSCDPVGTKAALVGGACNPPGAAANKCNTADPSQCNAPSVYLAGKGLAVKLIAPAAAPNDFLMNPNGTPHTGAAYVLVSHGATGGGGYLNSGQLFTSTTAAPGDSPKEQFNYNNQALPAFYTDDSLSEVPGNGHFDDIVSRPSVISVANKAGLGARAHP
jgi:prepilin-type N-terminal cleavage/methylation domain-containing protein